MYFLKPKHLLLLLVFCITSAHAGVLPDERTDVLFHSYDGGQVEVNGPSILIRKNATTNTSVFYNYYIDNITSASLDVQVSGSAYSEERTEHSLGVDYLYGKTNLNFTYSTSTENDYAADTLSFSISQDFFGDLSTLVLGYSLGEDKVGRRVTTGPGVFTFEDRANITRQSYQIGFNQIISKNATAGLGFETITDEGTEIDGSGVTLNSPYRQYSYDNGAGGRAYSSEVYPRTRTSNALSLRGNYFLSHRGALHGEYKYFQDSWGIVGHTFAVGYTHPIRNWIFDFRYRLYSQSKADFYSDLFSGLAFQNFMARDKELSTYTSTSVGISASYEFMQDGWGWFDKGTLNASLDHIEFVYDDYRDATVGGTAGTEPTYTFGADVLQLFVSVWY